MMRMGGLPLAIGEVLSSGARAFAKATVTKAARFM
jgi:hypothetical protein